MNTMGLDLSLTSTGLAVWNGRRVVHHERIRTPGPREAPFEARVKIIYRKALHVCRRQRIALVAIEGAAYGRPNQAFALGGLSGVVRQVLYNKQIPFVLVPPLTLKKFATGSGRASKEEMVLAAQPYLAQAQHDVADAIHLAIYAHVNYRNLLDFA